MSGEKIRGLGGWRRGKEESDMENFKRKKLDYCSPTAWAVAQGKRREEREEREKRKGITSEKVKDAGNGCELTEMVNR